MQQRTLIEENVTRHDAAASEYDRSHREIFNPTEQRRLVRELDRALGHVAAGEQRALDYGCGTGNLTGKLLLRGWGVWAADVSSGMLDVVRAKHPAEVKEGRLTTIELSLEGPLPFPDRHFAFVAAYSVLHHVPDYLQVVRELARVVDAGGVLYLDHEYSEDHWRSPIGVRVHRALTMPRYSCRRVVAWLLALFGRREPPLPPPGQRGVVDEGDIHIYADDHVEWAKVRACAAAGGLIEVPTRDYLLCRETSRFPIRHWLCRRFASDMGMYVGYRPLAP